MLVKIRKQEMPNPMADYVQDCLQKDLQNAFTPKSKFEDTNYPKGIVKSSPYMGKMKNAPAIVFENFRKFYLRENAFLADATAVIILKLLIAYEIGKTSLDLSLNEYQQKQLKWLVYQNYVCSRKYRNEDRFMVSLSAQFFAEFDREDD